MLETGVRLECVADPGMEFGDATVEPAQLTEQLL